jgi:hypothetical protein
VSCDYPLARSEESAGKWLLFSRDALFDIINPDITVSRATAAGHTVPLPENHF